MALMRSSVAQPTAQHVLLDHHVVVKPVDLQVKNRRVYTKDSSSGSIASRSIATPFNSARHQHLFTSGVSTMVFGQVRKPKSTSFSMDSDDKMETMSSAYRPSCLSAGLERKTIRGPSSSVSSTCRRTLSSESSGWPGLWTLCRSVRYV